MVRFSFTAFAFALAATSVLAIPRPAAVVDNANGQQNVGKGDGSQFITGRCLSNADCGSGCCANIIGDTSTGVCSGPAVSTVAGKNGCGFASSGAGKGNGNGDDEGDNTNDNGDDAGNGNSPCTP